MPLYLGIIFNPIYITIYRLKKNLERVIKPIATTGVNCLDVGCGDRPYEHLFEKGKYVGIDVSVSGRVAKFKKPDLFYDGTNIPFGDNYFDLVICTQVLEHVSNPLLLIQEMARVCKPDGGVIISLPFVYPEHEVPFDYFRFSSFGTINLIENSGLVVQSIQKDSTAMETLAVIANVFIVSNLVPKVRGAGHLIALLLCFPIQLISLLLSKILPDNGQLYLNLVIHAKRK
jgi:ubiquinone/menaquinone biosynthesis C-methylase UbiE